MPRNGSGVYSRPAGTAASPNTTITSAQFNSSIDDIASDLNTPRPISAGGTGSTSAAAARTALDVAQKQASATDETAGRGLLVGSGGLLSIAPAIPTTDLNSVTTGLYWAVNTSVGISNLPTARPGLLTVGRRADGRIAQTYQVVIGGTEPLVYVRAFGGTSWTAWQLLVGLAEAGAITLGVRGSILYERYSDGTQVAYGFLTDMNMGTGTGFFNQWRSPTQTVAWSPLTWSGQPRVVVTVREGSAPGVVLLSENATEFTYAYTSTSSGLAPIDRSITFHARGRWK